MLVIRSPNASSLVWVPQTTKSTLLYLDVRLYRFLRDGLEAVGLAPFLRLHAHGLQQVVVQGRGAVVRRVELPRFVS